MTPNRSPCDDIRSHKGPLHAAAEEIRTSCLDSSQKIKTVVINLADHVQVLETYNLDFRLSFSTNEDGTDG